MHIKFWEIPISHVKQFNQRQEKLPDFFEEIKGILKQQIVDVTNSFIMQNYYLNINHQYQKLSTEFED